MKDLSLTKEELEQRLHGKLMRLTESGKNRKLVREKISSEALKVAGQKARNIETLQMSIFCDSQTAIKNLREGSGYAGQALKI